MMFTNLIPAGRERALLAATAIVAGTLLAVGFARATRVNGPGDDWPVTGGDPGNSRYSPLTQIDRGNVARLRVAWTWHSGDAPNGQSQIQATPIVVNGVLFTTTPALAVVALRADRGTELWRFDPFAGREREVHANRGVAYWTDGKAARIFFTAGSRLYALDASSGRPVPTFGTHGSIDLREGLGRDVSGTQVIATSPGAIFRDLLIQGTRVSEAEGAAPGFVRAYDIRTGRVRWTFHTIPQPGEPGYESWPAGSEKKAGGANSWAGMSVDVARGIVYVPTGSSTPDFYGGARHGANLYANSLIALDAATGARRWHFQTVHHDIWDRDLPAAPNLLTVRHDGRTIDAVAQITKTGFVFLFDRQTGAPLFPVEERAMPASDLDSEAAWPTQPIPLAPKPFARQTLGESGLSELSAAGHDSLLARFHTLRSGPLFTPPSVEGTIVFPGFDGGGEWGGAAVDRERGVIYVNASDVPWIAAMRPTARPTAGSPALGSGDSVYQRSCAGCHGAERKGNGDRAPSLVGIGERLTATQIRRVIEHGRGFMPAIALNAAEETAVVSWLRGERVKATATQRARRTVSPVTPYEFAGYERWRDPDGYPAVKPPWGTLSAIDLNTGEYRWRITLGEHPELTAKGIAPTGTEQYGGPIVTAGGLVFIGATTDAKIRAFDGTTGEKLWEATLPAPAFATPSTYMIDGRQYVVIAAGGGKLGTPSSDTYVSFALP
jgi:quinoprotein glucose dehydrogenase